MQNPAVDCSNSGIVRSFSFCERYPISSEPLVKTGWGENINRLMFYNSQIYRAFQLKIIPNLT